MIPNVEIFGEHFLKFNKIRGGVKLTFKLSKTWITGFAIVWITLFGFPDIKEILMFNKLSREKKKCVFPLEIAIQYSSWVIS